MSTVAGGVPLSNDDEAVIHRSLADGALGTVKTPGDQLAYAYEIQRTNEAICRAGHKKVALQFPDELLIDAAAVAALLREANDIGSAFYVLGDTSYGSCCVDEVAAEHVNADVIVHYGRSCLSPTSKLPVIYVFGRLPLDVDTLLLLVQNNIPDKSTPLLIVTDTTYFSSQDKILVGLQTCGYSTIVASKLISDNTRQEIDQPLVQRTLPGRIYALPAGTTLTDTTMLYIGPPSPTLTTTLMTHSSLMSSIYSYDPLKSSLALETSQNRALRRRYAVVQKARDAGVIGIVVGTLGVSRYLDLIKHLREMITKAGRKSYLFAMGKLNPSKMANFSEIDAFVLVACGENSLIESRDFYKPVVTPFELSLALRTGAHEAIPWTNDWITDFEKVLSMPASSEVAEDETNADSDAPHFSLVTGQYSTSSKPMYKGLETSTDTDFALTKRSEDTTVGMVGGLFSPAAQHLNRRQHWAGLGTDHDSANEHDSVAVSQGRIGIARDYGQE